MNALSDDIFIDASGCPPLPRLSYSMAEAAQVTGLGRTTLYALIARGTLPSRKIGKRRVIRGADLEALLVESGGK